MKDSSIIDVFFALLRAGLWEKDLELHPNESVDFDALYTHACAQSVVGLVAAGMEHITDTKVQKMQARPFLKDVFAMERRNTEMNALIGELVSRLRAGKVFPVLIKGQGIAQCYDRPLWRASGDIDFLLDAENYEKAKTLLFPVASSLAKEGISFKHQGMTINGFEIELHGTFRFGMSRRVDRVIDSIQDLICSHGQTRVWFNKEASTDILLPSPDNDILIIFTHFLRHFYKGGIGLRQICDWCRLLWTFRDTIDRKLLVERLEKAGLEDEWKAFGVFSVDYLGMPVDSMPLFEDSLIWHQRANRIRNFILRVGNFGHSRDMSYYQKYPYVIRKAISANQRIVDSISHMRIFPKESIGFLFNFMFHGFQDAMRGE